MQEATVLEHGCSRRPRAEDPPARRLLWEALVRLGMVGRRKRFLGIPGTGPTARLGGMIVSSLPSILHEVVECDILGDRGDVSPQATSLHSMRVVPRTLEIRRRVVLDLDRGRVFFQAFRVPLPDEDARGLQGDPRWSYSESEPLRRVLENPTMWLEACTGRAREHVRERRADRAQA